MKSKSSRRWVAAAVMVAAGSLVLSGCGTAMHAGGSTKAGGGKVTVWSGWAPGTPMEKYVLTPEFAEFTKETGIKVDVKTLGDAMYTQAQQTMASGGGPDVMSMTSDKLGDFTSLLAPVTPVLDSKTTDGATLKDALPEQLIKAGTADGKELMVPQIMEGYGLWYDATKHPEIAANPPKTWDQFISVLNDAKAKGETGIALDGTNANHTSRWFYYPLLRLAGPGSLRSLGTTKDGSAWDNPNVLKAAQYSSQLAKGGYFNKGYEGSKFPNAQNAWAKGNAVFELNGSWIPTETQGQAPANAKQTPIPFPSMPGSSGKYDNMVEVGALGWAINKHTPNMDNVKKLLTFLNQQKISQLIADKAQNLPARTDVKVPDSLAPFLDWVSKADTETLAFDGATSAAGTWWDNVLTPLTSKLMFGQISPQEFVSQGKANTITYWKSQG